MFGVMARLSQTLLIVVLPGSLAFWLLEVRVTRLALDSVLAKLCVPWLYSIGREDVDALLRYPWLDW